MGDVLMAEIDAEMEVEEGMQRLAKISKEEAKEENKGDLDQQIRDAKIKNDLLTRVDEAL